MPYFTWQTILLNKLLVFIILLISILNLRGITKKDLFIIPLFIYFLCYIAYSYSSNLLGYISISTGLFILLIDKSKTIVFFRYFKFLFVFSLALSLIVYILIVFVNINIPYNLIEPLQKDYFSNVYQYPFLVSVSKLGFQYYNIRFSGMFDEPGVVGTLAVFFLFADNFNYKNRENYILLIAGLLSFSLYFYICIIVKYLLIASNKIRVLFIFLVFLFVYLTYDNLIINLLVWNRFKVEDGTFLGDNRTTKNFDASFDDFLKSGDLLWGKGTKYTQEIRETSSSYKSVIISFGLVFFCILIMAFSLNAYFNITKKKHLILYLLLFLGMMYQRPSFMELNYFFLLISGVYMIEQKRNIEDNNS